MVSNGEIDLNFNYDETSDVLYAFKGKPRPNVAEEPSDGILILREIKTRKIIGFMILNYKRQKRDGYLKEIPHFPNVEIPSYDAE